jgi:hypothetical protein
MSVPKLKNLGVKTTGEVPTLPTSMHLGTTHRKSSETGPTPSLYDSMHLGTTPKKSGQPPTQKLIDTMRIGRSGK